MAEDVVVFKNFSRPRPRLRFAAGPDEEEFEAYPVMPPVRLQELMGIIRAARSVDTSDESKADRAIKMFEDFFVEVLLDESIDRFRKKLSDRMKGVQLEEAYDIFQWLIERYGLRPTQSSSPSSTGSPSGDDGKSSTDGVSLEGSDPSN